MRNIEALKNYFLGKDPQLKETMADNSLRLIGIPGKNFVLRTELLKRLQELRKHVDDSDKELQDAIDGLIHDLSLEEAAREGADRDLQNNIDAEANTRSTNDGLLQGQLNNLTPRVAGAEQDIDNLEAKSFFNVLTEDLHIPETEEVTSLTESGWYYTGEHQVYYGDTLDAVVYTQAIFYFYADSGDQWFCFFPPKMENGWDQICSYLWFDNIENKWVYDGIDITSSTAGISDQSTDNSVPTSKAVYDFVGNELPGNFVGTTGIDNGQAGLVPAPQTSDMGKYLKADGTWANINDTVFQELTSPVRIWDLAEGTYKLPAGCTVYYYGATNTTNYFTTGGPSYLFITEDTYNGDACKYYTCLFGLSATTTNVRSGGTSETTGTTKIFSFNLNYETTGFKVTSLSNASTDAQYPSAKCVYDFANGKVNGNNFITDVWKGTQAEYDLIANPSSTTLYIIE